VLPVVLCLKVIIFYILFDFLVGCEVEREIPEQLIGAASWRETENLTF
jgi:hypothetical protein